jgi:hypothetical protein
MVPDSRSGCEVAERTIQEERRPGRHVGDAAAPVVIEVESALPRLESSTLGCLNNPVSEELLQPHGASVAARRGVAAEQPGAAAAGVVLSPHGQQGDRTRDGTGVSLRPSMRDVRVGRPAWKTTALRASERLAHPRRRSPRRSDTRQRRLSPCSLTRRAYRRARVVDAYVASSPVLARPSWAHRTLTRTGPNPRGLAKCVAVPSQRARCH